MKWGSSVAGRVSVPSRGLGLGKKMISRRDAKPPREEEESHSHEIHGNHERGEAPESAASAVVFLSAYVWSWVVLGNPLIRGKKRISHAKTPRPKGKRKKSS